MMGLMEIGNVEKKWNVWLPVRATPVLLFGIALLVLSYSALAWYNLAHGAQSPLIDSDASSELLLAKHLAQTGQIVSQDWYYSTELRLINTQMVMAPLFHLFGDQWNLVRSIGNMILYGLLVAGYLFLMKQMGVKLQWAVLTAAFLLLPFSRQYWTYVLFGAYYIPHLCFLFVAVGLFLRLQRVQGRKAKAAHGGVLLALSFVLGMSTIRYLLIIFVPLLLAGCWVAVYQTLHGTARKSLADLCRNRYFLWTAAMSAMSFTGYLVNSKILTKYFFYDSLNDLHFTALKGSGGILTLLQERLQSFLIVVGYQPNVQVLSKRGILNVLIMLMVVTITVLGVRLYRRLNWREDFQPKFSLLFCAMAFVTNLSAFICTDDYYAPRYAILVLVWFMPVAALIFQYSHCALTRQTAALLCVVTVAASGYITLKDALPPGQDARKPYLTYLESQNLHFGYSTFWNANITTELSNGAVEIASVNLREKGLEPYHWLAPRQYFAPTYAAGEPVFLLLTKEEAEKSAAAVKNGEKAYEDGQYVLYLYPSNTVFRETYNLGTS